MKNLSVAPQRILFIGNSATYVHDIPGMLRRLAGLIGYPIEVDSVVKREYTLAQHADNDSEHGKKVLAAIEKGWDIVFLQDNGNCVTSPEKEESCRTLHRANRAFAFGIRRGISLWGTDNAHTSEQGAYLAVCAFFSILFGVSSRVLDANGLAAEDAALLQKIADAVVLEQKLSW